MLLVMPSTLDTAELPTASKAHATCAWCGTRFASIVELIDHVDRGHVETTR
jgi:hypothetical protein